MEGRILDGVPVDLANVEILAYLGDLLLGNVVSSTPNLVRRRTML